MCFFSICFCFSGASAFTAPNHPFCGCITWSACPFCSGGRHDRIDFYDLGERGFADHFHAFSPAAIARRFASGPEQMALIATLVGIIAVFGVLYGSLQWDTPAGLSIVVAASAFIILTVLPTGSF